MKKTGTGLLWSLPEMWEVGKNCHLEKIVCQYCQSLETACVLHTQGEPLRSHLCQRCGGYISAARWKLANIAERCAASCNPVEETSPGSQGTLF